MSAAVASDAVQIPKSEPDQAQSSIAVIHEKLTSLRAKLAEPSLTKESILMVTTDLQPLYKRLLMIDMDRGVQKQLENFLWNDCFKKPLSTMNKVDDGLFHLMIESGIGFYMGMVDEIARHHGIKLSGQNEAHNLYCTTPKSKPHSKQQPSKDGAYYIIQNSIIHVGDLLRYRNSFQEAQLMYEKATKIGPSNGHPWNQMGLVQLLISGSIESVLLGVYCYARALSVSNPFLPAQQNLEGLLNRSREMQPGSPTDELIQSFLRQVLSIITGSTSPTRFALLPAQAQALSEAPMENLTRDHIFMMIVVSLWVWKVESDKMYLGDKKANSVKALELVAAVINGMLSSKLITSEQDEKFELVAHLNIMLQWIHLHPEVLVRDAFKAELNTATVCQVANQITTLPTSYLATDEELGAVILPEERRLLGFLPVARAFENLKTMMEASNPRCNAIRATRFLRLMDQFAKPESELVRMVGNEFRELEFKVPAAILRPAPRQNVALQSLLKQMHKPTSSSSTSTTGTSQRGLSSSRAPDRSKSSAAAAAADGGKGGQAQPKSTSSSAGPSPRTGSSQSSWPTSPANEGEAISRWEEELNSQVLNSPRSGSSASLSGPPPPGFPRPHSGLSYGSGHGSVFSAGTSPVPSASATPTRTGGNFSLLFNSIWTPMGHEPCKPPPEPRQKTNPPW